MVITDELIAYLEELGRIRLSHEAEQKTKQELEKILAYIDTLGELDTDDVEPMSHTLPVKNVFREDEVRPSVPRDEILENAPKKKDGCFMVPRTVE